MIKPSLENHDGFALAKRTFFGPTCDSAVVDTSRPVLFRCASDRQDCGVPCHSQRLQKHDSSGNMVSRPRLTAIGDPISLGHRIFLH